MLSAKDLKITFNPGTPIENRALRGMSLEIPTGQFVTVIGSNGAGKSTFLNAISGDLSVDSGTISIDGNDVTKKTAWQRASQVPRSQGRRRRRFSTRRRTGSWRRLPRWPRV
jgi:putative ABC transport system ATP-binding protein